VTLRVHPKLPISKSVADVTIGEFEVFFQCYSLKTQKKHVSRVKARAARARQAILASFF
jgi:hypothetical protein